MNSGGWMHINRKTRVEELPKIDVRELNKVGALRNGVSGTIMNHLGYQITFEIGFQIYEMELRVDTTITQFIELSETHCHYGGKRKWLLCPSCRRRVVALYGYGYIRCRHCLQLTYFSQNESNLTRLFEKMRERFQKVSNREPSIFYLPSRPKGMHRKTYTANHYEFKRLQAQAINMIEQMY